MRVQADLGRCEGYANCLMAAPSVFTIDDEESIVVIRDEQPSEEYRDAVEEAVRSCPVAALAIEED